MNNFRLPDGVSHEGQDDDGNEIFRVSIPLDERGYFGRLCPSCGQLFRIRHEDYDALTDDLRLWCVYCGHQDDHSDFMTEQQKQRVTRVALDAGMQIIGGALDDIFGGMARRSRRGAFVSISYRSKPFYPQPLPGINEEQLVRERCCDNCGVHYAVFGDHRFCPVSGPLPAETVAADALAAETARLDALTTLTTAAAATLREQGVFDRIYVDTVKGMVGIVETMAERVFRERLPEADALLKGKGNAFQRLDDLADLFGRHLGTDVQSAYGIDWAMLTSTWAARHVHVHNDGHVDERYLRAVRTSTLRLGQRVVVTEALARAAIEQTAHLCNAIALTSA